MCATTYLRTGQIARLVRREREGNTVNGNSRPVYADGISRYLGDARVVPTPEVPTTIIRQLGLDHM